MADLPCLVLALEYRMLSDALATALTEAGFEVVVRDAHDLSSLDRLSGCTVLLDVDRLDDGDVRSKLPSTARVLAQVSHVDDNTVERVLAHGASGVVSLDASLDDLRQAIVTVSNGSTVVSGVVVNELVRAAPTPATDAWARHLTARETSILARLGAGASTREIAVELGITQNTARTHIQRILGKLGVHSRVEASAVAARQGLARL